MERDLLRMPTTNEDAATLTLALRRAGVARLPGQLTDQGPQGRLSAELGTDAVYLVRWETRAGVVHELAADPVRFDHPGDWNLDPGDRRGLDGGTAAFRDWFTNDADTRLARPFFTAAWWAQKVGDGRGVYRVQGLHRTLCRLAVLLAHEEVRDVVRALADTWAGEPADLIPAAEATLL